MDPRAPVPGVELGRAPNWFIYWPQLISGFEWQTPEAPGVGVRFPEDLSLFFVQDIPRAAGLAYAWHAWGWPPVDGEPLESWPNNLVLLDSQGAGLHAETFYSDDYDSDGVLGQQGVHAHVLGLATVLRHESAHIDQLLDWSSRIMGGRPPLGADVTSEYRVPPGFNRNSGHWNHYFDFNQNQVFDRNLACDLDGDGAAQRAITEGEIFQDCEGEPTGPVDVDGDGRFVSLVEEWNIESLDEDYDGIPNWVEGPGIEIPDHAAAHPGWDHEAVVAEDAAFLRFVGVPGSGELFEGDHNYERDEQWQGLR